MRLKVMFRADALPIFYRHLFMGIIKEAIRKTDNEYYQHLYFYQHKTNKAARPFCFAVRFPFDRVKLKEKERFYLQGPGQLHLSTPDPFLFTCLYNGLLKIKKEKEEFPYRGYSLKIDRMFMLNEKKITGNEAVFKTLSPILIENKAEKPCLPFDKKTGTPFSDTDEEYQEFLKELNYIADKTLCGVRGHLGLKEIGLKEELIFFPIKLRKEVVKHKVRERDEKEKIYTFTCFSGMFKLKGHPEDLNLLSQVGLGFRRAQGFGMLEVV